MKSTQRIQLLCLCLCFCLVSQHSFADSAEIKNVTKRNLFVGNSFSFYNNGVHNHYSNLIRASGEWRIGKNYNRLSTLSGGSLFEHEADLTSILTSAKTPYQGVVLQAHSAESTQSKRVPRFQSGAKTLVDISRKYGAKPLLFMTWGYRGSTKMSKEVAEAFTLLGEKLEVEVIPVGLAFAHVEKNHPAIDLFVPDILGVDKNGQISFKNDWKHPSMAGTYLAACVLYAAIENKPPLGSKYIASLDIQTATTLQQVAWQIVQEYKKEHG